MSKGKTSFDLFANPDNSARAVPFWSWDSIITREGIKDELAIIKEMGFGGFFIHARVGMNVPYLQKEWFDRVKESISEAKKYGMEAWLYDEDRWPSGSAGGMVTKKYPQYTEVSLDCSILPDGEPMREGGIAYFAILPNKASEFGRPAGRPWDPEDNWRYSFKSGIKSYRRISGPKAKLRKGEFRLGAFMRKRPSDSWYNNGSYIDTLNVNAVKAFVRITHDAYAKNVGKDFGKTVPGIFFDEPTYETLPWTPAFPEHFRKRMGYDLLGKLPELFFHAGGQIISKARYDYLECATELFTSAFAKTIGRWCDKHGILSTGHMLEEDALARQTRHIGAAMRSYEYMQRPGIDLLTEKWDIFDTAMQCSSAARQFGRGRRLTETYGCTGWDFPFEGHKALGDWQAALGINFRVPHLIWYTMEGENKRDYPASIFMQSPWYKKYSYVEDYFARIGSLMNDGAEQIDILMVHPIESMWALCVCASSKEARQLEDDMIKSRNSLLNANLPFDYGDEEQMSRIASAAAGKFNVGKASYKAVVIPPMLTIRSSTLKLLESFVKLGGSVFCIGSAPEYIDARPAKRKAAAAFKRFKRCTFANVAAEVAAIARRVSITDEEGSEIQPALHLLSQRADGLALFVCNTSHKFDDEVAQLQDAPKVRDRKLAFRTARIAVRAPHCGDVYEMDASTGAAYAVHYEYKDGAYAFATSLPRIASRLFLITKSKPARLDSREYAALAALPRIEKVTVKDAVEFDCDEPNAIVLDHADSYAIDGKQFKAPKFILEIDMKLREAVGLARRGGAMEQPWLKRDEPSQKSAKFSASYSFTAKALPESDCTIALEMSDALSVRVNGVDISREPVGRWMDPCLKEFRVPASCIKAGKNVVEVSGVYTDRCSGLEAMFLRGRFGVDTAGRIAEFPKTLKFSDYAKQGLLNYTGNITYHVPVSVDEPSGAAVKVALPKWSGAALEIGVRGGEKKFVAWPPYEVELALPCGDSDIDITVYGNRRNALGPFYFKNTKDAPWYGPGEMRRHDTSVREYVPMGILAPIVLS